MFTRPIYCYSLLIFLFALFPFSAGRSYLGWEYRFLEAGACPSLGLGFPFFFFLSYFLVPWIFIHSFVVYHVFALFILPQCLVCKGKRVWDGFFFVIHLAVTRLVTGFLGA